MFFKAKLPSHLPPLKPVMWWFGLKHCLWKFVIIPARTFTCLSGLNVFCSSALLHTSFGSSGVSVFNVQSKQKYYCIVHIPAQCERYTMLYSGIFLLLYCLAVHCCFSKVFVILFNILRTCFLLNSFLLFSLFLIYEMEKNIN